jgi:cyanophycin synthetase
VYKVAIRYRNETVARACLHSGLQLLLAAIHDRSFDTIALVESLKEIADEACLGPSTAAIVEAAEARGIPTHRLTDASLVQLGQGARQRRIWTAETDRTSAIAEWIASDKDLTKQLLHACGVPVPEGRRVRSAADAWAAAQDVGVPVVVKPLDANHGRGVFTDLSDRAEIERAFDAAFLEGSGVLVERFVQGNEHRLLVVGDRVVAAARGETAWVVGDGRSTVRELVVAQLDSDPRRGVGEGFPLNLIELHDAVVLLDMQRQGHSPDSVPANDERVMVQRNGNVAFDVTDDVHPTVAQQVVLAAQVVGLDIAGIDLVAGDISLPLKDQRGAVVEVNAGPGLLMHLKPASGTPRPVGEAIIDNLFPAEQNGRIPLVCVTGSNGKTVVTRLVGRMLGLAGFRVGLACSDGFKVAGRTIEAGEHSDAATARKVLLNPAVDAAVIEAGAPGILREGLGFDRCDVAVVTCIGQADHLGQHFVETPDDMYTVKRCPVDVVLPGGTAVLNAQDPLVAEMAPLSAGSVLFFAVDPDHPVIAAHRQQGKRTVTARNGAIVLGEGDAETPLVGLGEVAFTQRGKVAFQVQNALAAVGAAWSLGLPSEAIRAALVAFGDEPDEAPGRFTIFEHAGAIVVVDSARNCQALEALGLALDAFPTGRRAVVFAGGSTGRDADLHAQGRCLGDAFDRIVLCDDRSIMEPQAGSLRNLLHCGASSGSRRGEIVEIPDRCAAIEAALAEIKHGDIVVVQTDQADPGSTVNRVRVGIEARRT